MLFEVHPKALGQHIGPRTQGPVVDCGLALLQVVDEEVPNGATGDRVTIDKVLDRALSNAADLAQGRHAGTEVSHFPQHLEGRRARERLAAQVGLGVENLQDVADRDIPEPAALGGDDHGATEFRIFLGLRSYPRILLTDLVELFEPLRVTGADHVAGQLALLPTGEQPAQRWSGLFY